MARKKPLIVDLSLDWDFFCREESEWDFGHSESEKLMGVFLVSLWHPRYASLTHDLKEGTNMRKWADLMPGMLPKALHDRKFHFVPKRDRKEFGFSTHIAFAESHKHAFSVFAASLRPADFVVNIDAHHDLFSEVPHEGALNCGNWGTALYDRWHPRGTQFIQVYPSWKFSPECHAPGAREGLPLGFPEAPPVGGREVKAFSWRKWRGMEEDVYIRNIYFCRSGVWTPPHHDEEFFGLARILAQFSASMHEVDGGFVQRPVPSEEWIQEWKDRQIKMVDDFKAQRAETASA